MADSTSGSAPPVGWSHTPEEHELVARRRDPTACKPPRRAPLWVWLGVVGTLVLYAGVAAAVRRSEHTSTRAREAEIQTEWEATRASASAEDPGVAAATLDSFRKKYAGDPHAGRCVVEAANMAAELTQRQQALERSQRVRAQEQEAARARAARSGRGGGGSSASSPASVATLHSAVASGRRDSADIPAGLPSPLTTVLRCLDRSPAALAKAPLDDLRSCWQEAFGIKSALRTGRAGSKKVRVVSAGLLDPCTLRATEVDDPTSLRSAYPGLGRASAVYYRGKVALVSLLATQPIDDRTGSCDVWDLAPRWERALATFATRRGDGVYEHRGSIYVVARRIERAPGFAAQRSSFTLFPTGRHRGWPLELRPDWTPAKVDALRRASGSTGDLVELLNGLQPVSEGQSLGSTTSRLLGRELGSILGGGSCFERGRYWSRWPVATAHCAPAKVSLTAAGSSERVLEVFINGADPEGELWDALSGRMGRHSSYGVGGRAWRLGELVVRTRRVKSRTYVSVIPAEAFDGFNLVSPGTALYPTWR